jgi:release factor glutamine methyltransferase
MKVKVVTFPEENFREFEGLVYKPADDSFLLVDALKEDLSYIKQDVKPRICLEIGCGSGIVITSVAVELQSYAQNNEIQFFATDINEHAIRATKKCLELNNVTGVDVVHTNLVDAVKKQLYRKCDLLVSNPPFEPSSEEEVGDPSVKCAWAAGSIGRCIIDMIIPELDDLMSENGVIYMAMVADNNIPDVIEQLKKVGFTYHKIIKERYGTTRSNFDRVYHEFIIRFSRK